MQAACSDFVNTLVRFEQDLWMCFPLFGLVRFGGFNIFCVGTCCTSTSASSPVCRAGCNAQMKTTQLKNGNCFVSSQSGARGQINLANHDLNPSDGN